MESCFALTLLLVLLLVLHSPSGAWFGNVTGPTDGATMKVLLGGEPGKERLWKIDCPE